MAPDSSTVLLNVQLNTRTAEEEESKKTEDIQFQ